ncbi:hypothetical protein ACSTHB_23400, partial [Vibrio parahaemolyticus]
GQFYAKAADRTKDVRVRALLTDLAEAEHKHITLAASLEQTTLTTDAKTEEEVTAKRLFPLQVVQPGLAGLIDG